MSSPCSAFWPFLWLFLGHARWPPRFPAGGGYPAPLDPAVHQRRTHRADAGALPSPGPEGSPSPAPEASAAPEDGTEPEPDFTLQEVLDLIGESELFSGLRGFLEEAVEEQVLEVTTTAAAAVAAYLPSWRPTLLLFGLSFLLILLVWFLISRALT